MKIFFLLPVINLLVSSSDLKFSTTFYTDTTRITHSLDGHNAEWPQQKFITDKTTKIRYATDNDSQMLFVVVNIADKYQQQKIMQQGMSLFVDVKGRKKENRGVEFPLGMENGLNIENMKVFGMGDAEPVPQNVKTEGTINIAIAWDTLYAMNIEYNIPLKMLEKNLADLNNKTISIGWKIKQNEMPAVSSQPASTTSRLVSAPSGTRPSSNRNVSNVNSNSSLQSNPNTSQFFWTSHTIVF